MGAESDLVEDFTGIPHTNDTGTLPTPFPSSLSIPSTAAARHPSFLNCGCSRDLSFRNPVVFLLIPFSKLSTANKTTFHQCLPQRVSQYLCIQFRSGTNPASNQPSVLEYCFACFRRPGKRVPPQMLVRLSFPCLISIVPEFMSALFVSQCAGNPLEETRMNLQSAKSNNAHPNNVSFHPRSSRQRRSERIGATEPSMRTDNFFSHAIQK
jgi:hypothetical protein